MQVFIIWIIVLAAALFLPVSQLIWVLSVRRAQRRLKRELNPEEIKAQRQRAYFIAFFISLLFATLYNLQTLGLPQSG